jgi:hypothetical protein
VQLWHLNSQPIEEEPNVTFTLGGENADGTDSMDYVDEPDKPQGDHKLLNKYTYMFVNTRKILEILLIFSQNKNRPLGNVFGKQTQQFQFNI